MTVRDPTPDLRVRVAESKSRDFEWAFNRLVDIIVELVKELPPEARDVTLGVMQRSFDQLHLENLERQAKLTRMANEAP